MQYFPERDTKSSESFIYKIKEHMFQNKLLLIIPIVSISSAMSPAD